MVKEMVGDGFESCGVPSGIVHDLYKFVRPQVKAGGGVAGGTKKTGLAHRVSVPRFWPEILNSHLCHSTLLT